MHATARSRAIDVTGAFSIVLGLVVAMLAVFVGPALAIQTACDDEGAGCSGPPANECFGLEYLDKFDWEQDGTGSFAVGDTSPDTDGSALGYAYTSTTGVTVSYTVVEDDGEFETKSVTWSSTTGIDRVWLKAGNDTNAGFAYNEEFGPITETVGQGFSHITFCYDTQDPTVDAEASCEGTTPTVAVVITNPDGVEFEVDVYIDDDFVASISATQSFQGTAGQVLEVRDGDAVLDMETFDDCAEGGGASPSAELRTDCDGTQPTATVTIDNDGDEAFEVEVFIDNVSQGTIFETTTFDGDAESVLRAEWGEDGSAEITFDDCTEDDALLSAASFTTGTECLAGLPVLTYDATVSETADDPIGDLTLTVVDANGVERGAATISESAAGNMQLPTDLEGATVTVGWDFDDTAAQQTLASDCADVLTLVDERDPDQGVDDDDDELPATEVKGEQVASGELPNTGAEHVILGLFAGGFLMLGGSMLLLGDRRRRVLA